MSTRVEMAGPRLDLVNVQTGPEFRIIDERRGVVGDLRISKSGAFWRQRGAGAKDYKYLTWEKVAEMFKKDGVDRKVGEYNWSPPPPPEFQEFTDW